MAVSSLTLLAKEPEKVSPYFIAEMSANHGNDLNNALRIVEAAAAAGANCLKVQTYTADTLTLDCDSDIFRIKGGLWDGKLLHELYSDASFPWEWHEAVFARCKELGIDFLSTPFDETAVDFLDDLGVEAFKIASFELVDLPLIDYAASKQKLMILSTGMATLEEIEQAVDTVRRTGNDKICLLHCCSEYPADPASMDLATIPDLARRFGCPVGFSDHSMGHLADTVAASLGAHIIEKHFCLDREKKTADSEFSMTPDDYAKMVRAVKAAAAAIGSPRYHASEKEQENLVFRRSIFAVKSIRKGEMFTKSNIRIIRPGYGAKPKYYAALLGRTAEKDYEFGEPVVYGEED